MKQSPAKLLNIEIGDSVEEVKKRLYLERDPDPYTEDPSTPFRYKLPENGLSIFFGPDRKVQTLHYEAPFAGRVDGVGIGDPPAAVLKNKGKPTRRWPIADGIDRWLYEKNGFLRVDFSPKTGLVEHIFR